MMVVGLTNGPKTENGDYGRKLAVVSIHVYTYFCGALLHCDALYFNKRILRKSLHCNG